MKKINKKTKDKLLEEKERIMNKAQDSSFVIAFDTHNIPTNQIQILRDMLREHGSIIKSKKNIMLKSLQNYEKNEQKLTEKTHLLFVKGDVDKSTQILQNFVGVGYLKVGEEAPDSFSINKGVIVVDEVPIPISNRQALTDCEVPAVVKDGCLVLEEDFPVCNKGEKITSKTEKILKILKKTFGIYKVKILFVSKKK